jgi:hypothetical protein
MPFIKHQFKVFLETFSVLIEAVAAIYRTVAARTERHLRLNAARGANYIVHFSLLVAAAHAAAVSFFARPTAVRATAGFVGEPFL